MASLHGARQSHFSNSRGCMPEKVVPEQMVRSLMWLATQLQGDQRMIALDALHLINKQQVLIKQYKKLTSKILQNNSLTRVTIPARYNTSDRG